MTQLKTLKDIKQFEYAYEWKQTGDTREVVHKSCVPYDELCEAARAYSNAIKPLDLWMEFYRSHTPAEWEQKCVEWNDVKAVIACEFARWCIDNFFNLKE